MIAQIAAPVYETPKVRILADPVLPPIPDLLPIPPLPEGVTDWDGLLRHPDRARWLAELDEAQRENDAINAMRDRVTRGAEDILEFGRIYFPGVFRNEFSTFHRELVDLVFAVPEDRWFVLDTDKERDPLTGQYPFVVGPDGLRQTKQGVVCAAPRGHGKSTILTFLIPVYCAVYRIKRFVLILSDSDDQARAFCAQIRSQIEDNELLRRDFGTLSGGRYGLRWTGSDFSIAHVGPDDDGKQVVQHECRIMGRSISARLRGLRAGAYRPDMVLLDDVENDMRIDSLDQRNKLETKLNRAVIPMLDPQYGHFFLCGTILHFDSLLARLLQPDKAKSYVQEVWRCIKEGDSVLDADAVPLWPEQFPLTKLRQVRESMTLAQFNTEWMNNPTDPESRDYLPEYIRWYRREDHLKINRDTGQWSWLHPTRKHPETGEDWWQDLELYQAVDPAISKKQTADYFAMVTVGLAVESQDAILINLVRKRLSFSEQVQTILGQFQTFNTTIGCAIEAVNYQDALRQTVIAKQAERFGVRRVPVKAQPVSSNLDAKERRLRARSWDVQLGIVWFPEVLEGDKGWHDGIWTEAVQGEAKRKVHPRLGELYREMMEFPKSGHDDCLDAFDMAMTILGKKRAFRDWAEEERVITQEWEARLAADKAARMAGEEVPDFETVATVGGALLGVSKRQRRPVATGGKGRARRK